MTYSKSKAISYTLGTVFGILILVLMFQYIRVFSHADDLPITGPISEPVGSPISTSEPTTNPTQTPTPDQNQGDSDNHDNNSGSNGGGSNGPAVCNSEKPHSAPLLTSWVKTGPNQVTIHWTKGWGPIEYYSVSFGLKPHQPLYGIAHVGDQNTTSATINSLSGSTTYYFTVEGVNGCVHSDPSNEVAVKINGAKLNQAVSITEASKVLSTTNIKIHKAKTPVQQPQQSINQDSEPQKLPESKAPSGLFDSIRNFFKLIFG